MSAEPALERRLILQVVRAEYGLELDSIAFLPYGTSHAYLLEGSAGRFFLKLQPNTPYGATATARVQAEIPLLHALRERGILTRVPRVISTLTGAEMSEVAGHPITLYAWIDAVNLADNWEAALPELAPLLGRLHSGTAQIMASVSDLPTPPEDFGLPFEQDLLEDLDTLRQVNGVSRSGVIALRDLLLPREADILHLLEYTRTYQAAARISSPEFVVCHTDAHGHNVMRDQIGELWIIDWETARLAPPEHDLWMLGAHLWDVLSAYQASFERRVELNPAVLGFYICRRVLEDLALDVTCIVRQNTRLEEDDRQLRIIRDYVLPALNQVEDDLLALRVR